MRNDSISEHHVTLSPSGYRDSNLKIAVVCKNPVRTAILEEGLRDAGLAQIERIPETQSLLLRISSLDPDVIVIDLENASRDMLAQMFQLSRIARRPVVIFVDQSDSASTQAAVDAGVAAYIVDGLKKERVAAIVDLAVSRFNAFSQLQAELESIKSTLNERKVIDRAKGMLMKARRLSEDEAYVLMRKTAMSENKKIVEIARSVLKEAELLK
jgi:two-component system, response regulator / RNA-binding antiterminator